MFKSLFLSSSKLALYPALEKFSTSWELQKTYIRALAALFSMAPLLVAVAIATYLNVEVDVDPGIQNYTLVTTVLSIFGYLRLARLTPLANDTIKCTKALSLSNQYPACKQYVRSRLALGRQLLTVDLQVLLALEKGSWEDAELSRQAAAKRIYGYSAESLANYNKSQQYLLATFFPGVLAGGLACMLWSKTSLGQITFMVVGILLLTVYVQIQLSNHKNAIAPVWRFEILCKDAQKLLSFESEGSRYLKEIMRNNVVLLQMHITEAQRLDSAENKVYKELHQINE